MRRRATRFVGLLLATALPFAAAEAQTLSIATGNPSGLYYPLGGGLASLWSRHLEGVNIKVEVTAGSVTNLIQVAKLESEVGFSQADSVADAVLGKKPFREPMPLAVLGKLYPNVVHLVTVSGSGISRVTDLRSRRVSMGPAGSGNSVTASNILRAVGIGEEEFRLRQLNYAETTNGLKDGTLDAGFIAAGLGVAAIVELAASRKIVLVPFSDEEMEAITALVPAYSPFEVPPGIYRGVDEPVQTPSLWNLLVVNRSMEDALAYRLIKAVFDYRRELSDVTQVAKFIVPETAAATGSLPMHPGAKRYYDEILGGQETAPR